jgi:hypothetical protein
VVWDLGAFGLLNPAQEEAAYLWAELASKVGLYVSALAAAAAAVDVVKCVALAVQACTSLHSCKQNCVLGAVQLRGYWSATVLLLCWVLRACTAAGEVCGLRWLGLSTWRVPS